LNKLSFLNYFPAFARGLTLEHLHWKIIDYRIRRQVTFTIDACNIETVVNAIDHVVQIPPPESQNNTSKTNIFVAHCIGVGDGRMAGVFK
jgi:hypothetical protein